MTEKEPRYQLIIYYKDGIKVVFEPTLRLQLTEGCVYFEEGDNKEKIRIINIDAIESVVANRLTEH